MSLTFDQNYWDERWIDQQTGWDIGHVSTPLKNYFDQLPNPNVKMVIPGAGNAYEAEYLHKLGFHQVHVVDISEHALQSFAERVPDFPKDHLIHGDFFELESNQYDLFVEQTFFCALHPKERKRYIQQAANVLKPEGKLIGLLFQIPLFDEHPPFGGKKSDYHPLFEQHFEIDIMETAYNSIKPRENNELFIKMRVKK